AESRERGLDLHSESLDRPEGRSECRKYRPRERHTAEYGAQDASQRSVRVEVKRVRELVDDDEVEPVLVECEGWQLDGRLRVDPDPIRRQRRRHPVRVIAIIRDDDVDRELWRPRQRAG